MIVSTFKKKYCTLISLNFIFFFTLINLNACKSNSTSKFDRQATKKITISCENPKKSALEISNQSKKQLFFELKINKGLFYDNQEILESINHDYQSHKSKSLAQTSFDFVAKNIKFSSPLTEQKWSHIPFIMFNSLGFGQCDDYASALAYIAKVQGFDTKIWNLNQKHVVSEIFINNNWQMYDASRHIFYTDSLKQIANIKILSQNTHLASQNIKSTFQNELDYRLQFFRYTNAAMQVFSSNEKNIIQEDYSDNINQNLQLIFTLPPKAILTFPIYEKEFELPVYVHTSADSLLQAYAKLIIPKNWNGTIDIPLVVAGLRGETEWQISEQKFGNNTKAANDFLQKREHFDYKINIKNSKTDIEIIYFINPKLVHLQDTNTIEIAGNDIDNLDFSIIDLPDSMQIYQAPIIFVDSTIAKRNYAYFAKKRNSYQNDLEQLKNINDFKNLVRFYYENHTELNEIEKRKITKQSIQKINELTLKKENENGSLNTEMLMLKASQTGHFEYLLCIVESNKTEDIFHIFQKFGYLMQRQNN